MISFVLTIPVVAFIQDLFVYPVKGAACGTLVGTAVGAVAGNTGKGASIGAVAGCFPVDGNPVSLFQAFSQDDLHLESVNAVMRLVKTT